MKQFYRNTWVEVSLDALSDNLTQIKQILPQEMKLMAVVKADAYGHGAVEISKQAVLQGVAYLGVAFLDEAIELRQAGITAPILVLGYTPPSGLEVAWQHNVTITAYSEEVLESAVALIHSETFAQVESTTGQMKKLRVHVKVDTGMGRIGLHTESLAIEYIERMLSYPAIEVEGIYTHFANADASEKSYTYHQYERFSRIVTYFKEQGVHFPLIHTGNSATAIELSHLTFNMVRLGISMYGLYPSLQIRHHLLTLKPVMSLKTSVVHVKSLPPQSGISYGTHYFTKSTETIATLPIGYADGYSRMLSHKAHVLLHGQQAPIVGTICMDQCMIRLDPPLMAVPGDEVILMGQSGEQLITAEMIAKWLGTIHYEVTCMISHRVPRVYVSCGQRVHAVNALLDS